MLAASGAAAVAAAKAAEPPPDSNLSMRLVMNQVEENGPMITSRPFRLFVFSELESDDKCCSAEAIV